MPPTADQLLEQALAAHHRGDLDRAEDLYRQMLQQKGDDGDALAMLGVLKFQRGEKAAALELIRQAIAVDPQAADYHFHLGAVLADLGQSEEAIAAFGQALSLRPGYAEALHNLAVVLRQAGRLEQAVDCCRQALAIQPNRAETHQNLGVTLAEQGHLEEGIAALRQALVLRPDFPEALYNLGNALREAGRLDEAVAAYRQAVSARPDYDSARLNLATTLYNLGNAHREADRLDEAVAAYRQALSARPDFDMAQLNLATTLYNLGNALQRAGRLDEAVAAYHQALSARPDYGEARLNLAMALAYRGDLDAAIDLLRGLVRDDPQFEMAHGDLIYYLYFHPDCDAGALLREHLEWNRRHARPLAAHIQPHGNDRDPDRPLRIGYVSPDLRVHPVGRFLLPLFARHDHHRFEIVCFYNAAVEDDVTRYLRGQADRWHDISVLSDEQAAELVRREQIDILVDLSLHMAHNRLLVFARKPAPVQVTYLAYCGTSGLETMDYRLTDPYLDPEGMDESVYTEKSVRLPRTYWCYEPCIRDVAVKAPPAGQGGGVTFGCFNNYCKVSRATWETWGRLLQAVGGSRLMVCCPLGAHREQVRGELAAAGVDPQRLIFAAKVPMVEYLERYHEVDIGLDPFPYGGGTTTCDALWMGVPVVSLRGRTAVGRGGVSILSNLGLAELIAENTDQYVAIAKALAEDLPRLAELRGGLRQRMRRSPLMDGEQFARDVESAYRQMWRRWCTPGGGES